MLMLDSLYNSRQLKRLFKFGTQILSRRKSYFQLQPQTKILTILSTTVPQIRLGFSVKNSFHTNFAARRKINDEVEAYDEKKSLMYYKEFERWNEKNKKTFLETVRLYKQNVKNRAGHVDFIKAALKQMKIYGVHRDLECYKQLLDVLPKGVYVCTNRLLADGMYYPRQQFVALEVLNKISVNGVIPDIELGNLLENIFGKLSQPCQMYYRQFYFAMKFKNKSPFIVPRPTPSDPLMLAKLAVDRITAVDVQTEISVFETHKVEDSIDKTWIVSGQSPKQKKLLAKHPGNIPVVVEGGDIVHLLDKCVSYFILKADGEPLPYIPPGDLDDISDIKSKYFNPYHTVEEEKTVHEQDDGVIYAVCATGTSSKDSLLSWVRILEKTGNPVLSELPVLFRFKETEKLPAVTLEELIQKENTTYEE